MKTQLLKLLGLTFALFLFMNTNFAQDVSVEWGPIQKEIKGSYIYGLIDRDDEGFMMVRIKSGGIFSSSKYFFERYDAENKVAFVKEFKLENAQKKECSLEDVLPIKNGYVVFSSYYDSKSDKKILYGQTYDKSGSKISDMSEMDEIESKKKSNSGNFANMISEDGSKILVYHNEPYEKNKNERFNYKVYDNTLKLIWEKQVELPHKDKDVSLSNYTIDNDGYVFAMERIQSKIKVTGLFAKDKLVYDYRLITYDYKKDIINEVPLKLGGAKFVTNVTYLIDNKSGKIFVTGFYGNQEFSGIAGSIYLRIDKKTFKTEHESTSAFTKEFIKKAYENLVSEKKAKKATNLSTDYDLKKIIIKEDGGIMLIAEEYFVQVVTTTTTSSNGVTTTRTTYHYYYRNIIVLDLTSDGTIRMASVVPKSQHSVNDGGPYSSFISTLHNNKLYFWFNDNPKNTSPKTKPDKKGKYVMTQPKKAMVTMVTMDMDGSINTETFFKSKNDTKTILKPKLHYVFNPSRILVYAELKSNYKFGFFNLSK